MMGRKRGGQKALFYAFNLDDHVPADHLLRGIDRCLDLGELRRHLAPFYSHTGRPSVDPQLLIRMLIVGYCFGIRCRAPAARGCSPQSGVSLVLRDPRHATRAVREYLAALDAQGEPVTAPASISPTDPASRWTAVGGPAFYAYSTNYLVNVQAGIIVDVEATPDLRTDEVNSARVMLERVEERFALKPARLIGDMAYGPAPMLGWLVDEENRAAHSGMGPDPTRRRDVIQQRLPVGRTGRPIPLPAGQGTAQTTADVQEPAYPHYQRRHHHLPSRSSRLCALPAEGALLSEHADAQDRAQRP